MEVYKRAIFAGLLIICVLIAARKVYEKMKRKKTEKGDMVKQKIINIVGIFFLVIGITLLLYPEIISYLKQKQSDQTVKELTQRRSKRKQDDLLYQKAIRYNRKIFKEKQAGLKDVFSYRSAPIVLRNEKNTFGYIKIPKMKQKHSIISGSDDGKYEKRSSDHGTDIPASKDKRQQLA